MTPFANSVVGFLFSKNNMPINVVEEILQK
jgi:hypothetical protein